MSSALPFVTVISLAWLLIRVFARRDVLRLLAKSRRVRAIFGGAFVLSAIGVAVAFSGPLVVQLAAAAASLLAAAIVTARTCVRYGCTRGLPPGSLPVLGQMDQVDARFLLEQAERHGPVFKTTQAWRPTVCVVGLDLIAELLDQHGDRLSRGELPFSRLLPRGFLRYMDRATHAHYRPLLASLFAPSTVGRSHALMSAALRTELERLADACQGPAASVALGAAIPEAVLRVFILLFFGVRQGTGEMARLEASYRALDCRRLSNSRLAAARPLFQELNDRVRTLAGSARIGADQVDGGRCYVRTLAEETPALLADENWLGNVVAMVQVGSQDLASLLIWVWKYLCDHPQWQERLRAASVAVPPNGEDGVAERIVAETLRLDQSEYLKRTASDTFEMAGFTVPKGWDVRMCLRESHRDPSVFASPDVFDPDRFAGGTYPSRGYAPFGIGASSCPAGRFALVLSSAFLGQLATHYTWAVVSDGPRQHDGFHWAPCADFRVRLLRRSGGLPA
jgi:cytochrome P450